MEIRTLFTFALCLFALGGLALAQDDEQAIRDATTRWQDMFNQGDLEGVASLYTEDAWWSNFDGRIHEGRDAILQYLQNPDPIDASETTIEITTDEVNVAGDTAYSRGTYALNGLDGSMIARGNWISVTERVDGEWLIRWHLDNATMPSPEQRPTNSQ